MKRMLIILSVVLLVGVVGCGAGNYRDGYKTVNGYKSATGFTLFPRPETAKDIAEADAITARTHYMMSQQQAGNNLMYGVVENYKTSRGDNQSLTVCFYLKTDYDASADNARVIWSSTVAPGKAEFIYLPVGDYIVCVDGNCSQFSIDNVPFDTLYSGSHYDFYFNLKNP
jgi:hypothetical protein